MWNLILEKLNGISKPYSILYSKGVEKADLNDLELLIGNKKLPLEYRDLMIERGVIKLDNDGVESLNAEDHIQESNKVGVDYWFSFLWPKEAISKTNELKRTVKEDYENLRTLKLMDNAVVFQQGYGDANYYLFVVNESEELVIMYFDGDGSGSLNEISKDFKTYIEYYVQRFITIRRMKD
jgi:hypothetical protein